MGVRIVAAAVVVFLASACAGTVQRVGSPATTSTGASPSPTPTASASPNEDEDPNFLAFLGKANAICQKYISDALSGNPPSTLPELRVFLSGLIAADAAIVAHIRALGAYAGRDPVKKMLALEDRSRAIAAAVLAAIDRRDTSKLQTYLEELDRLGTQSDDIAGDLGLQHCVSG
jgi:hypothetical protein